MTQQTLFGGHDTLPGYGPAPFQPHSETSREAAERIEPDRNRLRGVVLAFIRENGSRGATDQEVETGTGLTGNCVRPRRRELEMGGKVRKSGEKRPTASGRSADVWVATETRTEGGT